MSDSECIALLQWALPRLHLRWPGFRKVRRQVCRRIDRRRKELGLGDVAAYRRRLEEHADEWAVLDGLCNITISRFGRDRAVWEALVGELMPRLAREASAAGRTVVTAWSAGCCSGEEPYTLAIAWELAVAPHHPGVAIDVLATDLDPLVLDRAAAASYPPGTLRELPEPWRAAAFELVQGQQRLRPRFRERVRFVQHDVRTTPPEGPFDLVLCRNLAFTYFDEPLQRAVAITLQAALRPGGVLVVGIHERVPECVPGLVPTSRSIYVASAGLR